jgi:hypothetical protein
MATSRPKWVGRPVVVHALGTTAIAGCDAQRAATAVHKEEGCFNGCFQRNHHAELSEWGSMSLQATDDSSNAKRLPSSRQAGS